MAKPTEIAAVASAMVEVLEPLDQVQRLRTLAAVAVLHGHYDHAMAFIRILRDDELVSPRAGHDSGDKP